MTLCGSAFSASCVGKQNGEEIHLEKSIKTALLKSSASDISNPFAVTTGYILISNAGNETV